MSEYNTHNWTFLSRSSMIVLISGYFVFGGLLRNGTIGMSDGSNILQTLIPISIMFYLVIILVLTLMGFKLKTHEMIVISLVLTLIFFSFFNLVLKPNFRVGGEGDGDDNGIENVLTRTSTEASRTNNGTFSTEINYTQSAQEQRVEGVILSQVQLFIITISIVILTVILIFVYARSGNPHIKIRFVDEQLYEGNYGEIETSIIKIYTTLSFELEKRFGRAPNWYSPTHFSEEISEKTIASISSTWDVLTKLYERARFGNDAMTNDDLNNAKELATQIKGQLKVLDQEMNKHGSI